MENRNTYNSNWSMDDIHDYLDGAMTASQVESFESDLLTDPFLKDAVDGYKGHAKLYVEHHLQRLHKEFKGEKSRMILPMWAMTAAAAVLLLAIAGWYIFSNLSPNSIQTADEVSRMERIPSQQQDQRQHALFEPDSAARTLESIDDGYAFDDENEMEESIDPGTVTPVRRQRKPKLRPGGIVSGSVIDLEGQPLIGANVYFPNNEAAITTDFDGNFAVELKAFDSMAIVNYTGYESSVFRIKAGQKQQFQLTEGLAVDKVALLNAKSQPITTQEGDEQDELSAAALDLSISADLVRDETAVRASPEKGFKKYERYIKRNLNYPLEARNEKIEGEVVVQFKVLPSGEYFDIRIIKSLGYGCDEEVMRLIKEGPQWLSDVENRIGEATYTVEFKGD